MAMVTARARTAKKAVPATAKKKVAARPAAKRASSRTAETPVVRDTPKTRAGRTAVAPAPTLQERREAADPKKRVGGLSYQQLADLTGYGLGSEHFITAVEIMKGAETRQEVNQRVKALLPETTRNGTPKQVSNLVGAVIRRMEENGFKIKGSWKMVRPGE